MRAAASSRKEARNAQPAWALLSPLLQGALAAPFAHCCCCCCCFLPSPSPFGSLPSDFAADGPPMLTPALDEATKEHDVFVDLMCLDLPTSCRGGGGSLGTPANGLQGGKTFGMRNKKGDPDPSCSQKRWTWGHLGSLQHLNPKEFLINNSYSFNFAQVPFKISLVY